LQWAQSHLGQALRVEDLARRAAMSPRTFARRFRQQTGTTPHQWLTHQRLLAAQMRLEKTDDGIDAIAEAVGLQTAAGAGVDCRCRMALDTKKRPRFASDRRNRLSHNCTPACVVGQAVSHVNPVTL
jgi:AraC-like DNA-binding protein